MTCLFSHKWPKWSTPVRILIPCITTTGPTAGTQIEVERYVQERTCTNCGRYERRTLTINGDEV